MLSCLLTLDLHWCDEIGELFELLVSLVYLHFKSSSLWSVPNPSNLYNLKELSSSYGSEYRAEGYRVQTYDLEWIGRLTKLKKLELCLSNVAAPPAELGLLSLRELTLTRLDLPLAASAFFTILELESFDKRTLET